MAGEVSFVALVLRLVLTPQDNPLFFPKLPVPKTYTRWDSVLGEGVCIWTLRSLICKQMHMCLSHTCVCLIHVSVSYMCQSHRCVSLSTCVYLICTAPHSTFCRNLKGARPAGDLVALREEIWDAMHQVYSGARGATADTAWKDEHLHFTGHTRASGSHRPASAAASTAKMDDTQSNTCCNTHCNTHKMHDTPAQLITGDVMIADMQAEIKGLEVTIASNRLVQQRKSAKEASRMWVVESKVRQAEKMNVFLRQVVMTEQMEPTEVDAINDNAVSYSGKGPESRTVLLHQSMALMKEAVGDIAGREFARIVPPCPEALLKPLSAAMPIRVWVLFVKDYYAIHHTYRYCARVEACKSIIDVKCTFDVFVHVFVYTCMHRLYMYACMHVHVFVYT